MKSIKEMAAAFEPKQTKNIADLDKVSVDMKIETRTFKEGTDEEFSVNVVVLDGEEYRVPNTVLVAVKAMLERKPDLKFISVSKSGSGLGTKYTVMPWD